MPPRSQILAAGLLAVVAAQVGMVAPVFAADAPAAQALQEQGRYWQSRNDAVRAAEAWGRLLQLDPQHAEALYNLGLLSLEAKRPADARGYLTSLQALGSADVQAARLAQEIALREGGRPQELEQARLLAGSGDLDAAIAQYRQLFGQQTPQGKVAVEYYSYLGYTDKGWEESRAGLERLHRESPDDANIALLLGKHLIRNEATRADGIRRLAALSKRPDVGGDATESWRLGLRWYGPPRPNEVPLFEQYLAAHPDDAEIRAQLQERRTAAAPARQQQAATGGAASRAADPGPVAAAFKALENGELNAAEEGFRRRLRAKSDDSDALAGLGLVRLRQDRPEEAEQLLARAVAQRGSRAGWRQVLTTARYWSLNAQAEKARTTGDVRAARRMLEQAVALNTGDDNATLALARIQADAGELVPAEQTYRTVLSRQPKNDIALEGLVNVLGQRGEVDEALQWLTLLPEATQQRMGGIGQLRARGARENARKALARGDTATAQRLLEDGLRDAPRDPWLRLDLARLFLDAGAPDDARGLVDGLLRTNPDLPDMQYVAALLAAELQDWPAAMTALSQIPQTERTPEIVALHRRVWVNRHADLARELAAAGQRDEARQLLAQVQPEAGADAALLGTLATAWVDVGDANRGLDLLRQTLSLTGNQASPALLMQYAGLLLRTEQDVEASGILRQLRVDSLNATERQAYEDLRKLYTVRQVEALRQRNRLADGYDVLAPLLLQYPDDALVLGTLARLYGSAGQDQKALGVYKELLQRTPDDARAWLAAATLAQQAGDESYADSAIATALRLTPADGEVLAGAARIYKAQGKSGKAAEYLKLAIAAQRGGPGQATTPGQALASAPVDSNPFANLPGQVRSRGMLASSAGLPAAVPTVQTAGPRALDLGMAPSSYGGATTLPTLPPARVRQTPLPEPVAPAPRVEGRAPATVELAYFNGDMSRSDYLPSNTYLPPSGTPRLIEDLPVAVAANATYGRTATPYRAASGRPATPTLALRSLEDELQEIQQQRSATISAGTVVRQHNGVRGLGRMTDVETPVTVRFPAGEGKGFVQAVPVTLRAGEPTADSNGAGQFGGGPAALAAQVAGDTGGPGNQKASGVGVAVGYEIAGLRLDVGTTPIGFRERNLIGGARYDGSVGGQDGESPRFSYGLDLSRRAVIDSVLSFAGARDARTGESWGGVTKTGGTASVGLHFPGYGFYGSAGLHNLKGTNVRSNQSVALGLGTYVNLVQRADRQVTTGLNLTAMSYDRNLSHYTYGQGGYFSPQSFTALSVPLSWTQRQGRLNWMARGSLGIQHIRQDASPYYHDATRQAQAENGVAGSARFASQSKTGLGYGLAAAAEYQLAPQWFLGAHLAMDNARDYRQFMGGLYVRYALEAQEGPASLPVLPVTSPYSME